MITVKNIYGTQKELPEVYVNGNSVYVRTNIRKCADTENNSGAVIFNYDETKYSKDEYLEFLSQKNDDLSRQLSDTQLALCDIYELLSH